MSSVASVLSVPHRQVPQWRMANLYKVELHATFEQKGFRGQGIENNGVKLPKNGTLRFEAKTDYHGAHRVYWQVVNTGQQAETAKSLRGGFYEGKIERGGKVRTESTLYEGKHWVECFIVRDGVCLARSGEFIVNIRG
ncbi:nucleotide-binding domain-containing protein [Celeribacter baekdonensis]|uniref:nucleotide-binding domain-containing protein n=1 Tax=Celeribacter baekdonensis TaxID=875171 RepID=UPI003A9102B8